MLINKENFIKIMFNHIDSVPLCLCYHLINNKTYMCLFYDKTWRAIQTFIINDQRNWGIGQEQKFFPPGITLPGEFLYHLACPNITFEHNTLN